KQYRKCPTRLLNALSSFLFFFFLFIRRQVTIVIVLAQRTNHDILSLFISSASRRHHFSWINWYYLTWITNSTTVMANNSIRVIFYHWNRNTIRKRRLDITGIGRDLLYEYKSTTG